VQSAIRTRGGILIGISAFNAAGESGVVVPYRFYADINAKQYWANDTENTSYQQARIDGYDLNILGIYYGQPVFYDPAYTGSPTLQHNSDIWKDSVVNGIDLNELGSKYGNMGTNYN
jgi:hypothetical protein